MGPAGIDMAEARARLEGIPPMAATHLLDEAEAGLVAGLSLRRAAEAD